MASNVIAERTQAGTPVVMVINSNNTISVLSKKQTGRKYDGSHNVEEFYEVNPMMAEEMRESSALPWLASFIAQMWEEVEDLDPWYIIDEDEADA